MNSAVIALTQKNSLRIPEAVHRLFGRIGVFFIGSSKKIVCAHLIKIGKCVQHGNGDIQFPQFIIGISGLMDLQQRGKILLSQVMIFP